MKCYVPGPNVKVLGRTIHALARFGDELYLESLVDCVRLRTLNTAESAYAMVKFNKNFFSYFNYNYNSNNDNDGPKCKISMKSALNTFKSPAHMDKQVENLEIKLELDQYSKVTQAVYTKDLVPNRITSSQRILSEAISNFQSSDDQVTLEALSHSILLRNYIDDNIDLSKIIRTQINIKSEEFDSYTVDEETAVTFTMKEFKALLTFAEALGLPIQIQFETTGKPIVFIIHNGTTLEAHFVLATTKPDVTTQASTTQKSSRVERNKRKDSSNLTESASKKPHLEEDISKCLDEDSHLFNFVDIPNEEIPTNNCDNSVNVENNNLVDIKDCDNIPASPTSKTMIKSLFKKCFESTFDPRSTQDVVLAGNSDSE
ncbi:PREDICTED: cell cycle checkpoint control protein RAD9A isoform X2 [Papilio xuthus]|uniref:Cell cycle checkpoint control protein RAD9A isoform X2 n=1 Tax=Papilio xuthus TaxID=66420 RepID=A0AAJ6Z8Y2_PAPXU|nr:PREDICTED: cell cycle checkpoint control protein RAD9A isoform X2 [Papilio xuthus]